MKRQYTIYNICVLLALLFLGGGWNDAWGQGTFPDVAIGQSEEVRYVISNTDYEIKLQRAGLRDNLNAYIHWYKEGNSNASLSSSDLRKDNDDSFSWSGLGNAPAGRITYRNSNVQDSDNDVLVCEASSIQNGRNTLVRRYLIREASTREAELDEARTKAIAAGWDTDNVEDLDINKIDQLKANFFESYEIHTPMESGTSYRLAEVLNNYIVKGTTTTGPWWDPTTTTTLQYPNQVRWRIYDSDGKLKKASQGDNGGYYNYTTRNNNTKNHIEYVTDGYVVLSMAEYNEESYPNLPNIFSYYYPYDTEKISEQQVFYLTAEVSYNGDKWYPVSFMTVYLEPNSETLTQDDLDDIEDYPDNVNYRRTSKYLSEPRFRSLGSVTFDGNNTSLPTGADENYPTFEELSEILKASSYYAFAAPRYHESRRGKNRFVGSGEYGLYKTLGFDNISPQNKTVGLHGYNNIYYSNYALETYKVKVADRLHETDNSKYGYFFYLDAAEEPGIITKINLGNSLCPNTRIIVTAWVCNLQTTDSNNDGSLNADIGLTFKGVLNDKETILTKFYSGEIKNNPAETKGEFTEFAKWQQVYFEFDYKSEVEYQNYILEVANNCRHAHGADYAIDDIQVYCSTPNIQVGRVNACDASTLAVDTDFETILQNMAWYENQDVTTGYPFNELSYRKYRYGLMGTDHSDPGATNATVGNAYFAFFDGPRTAPEWIIVNNSEDAAEVPAVRNTIRVIISTNKQQYPATEEDALEWERELNIRAIKDYNNDITLWQNENAQVHTGEIPIENIDTDETVYNTAIKTLYTRLEIPRIRCPWAEYDDGQLIIHLTKLNVADTNMKYVGQDENDDDEGHYYVILFRASEIAAGNTGVVDPSIRCALVSDFYVTPATDILIEADAKAETALCLGAYRNITPALVVYDDKGQQITDETELNKILGNTYIFDWYLSTSENYDLLTEQFKTRYSSLTELMKEVDEKGAVKTAIDTYRSRGYGEDTSEITAEEVKRWMTENPNNPNIQACGSLLLVLLAPEDGSDPLLRTGTPAGVVFKLQVNSKQIMAMPYVQAVDGYLICTTASPVDLPVSESFIPIILSGIYGERANYPDKDASAPLRLGLENISENETDIKTLTLPIRSITKAENADYLGIPTAEHISILLDDEANNYPPVGEITALHIANTDVESGTATLSFHLNADAKTRLKEGGEYNLLIPFVQYADADNDGNDGNDEILASECDGWISLPIKVVPKYLTWKGGATGVWYNDKSSWAFSTKNELYNKSDVTHTAENTYTFSPLYFTKITIPEGSELALEDKEPGTGVLTGLQDGATKDIEYDLAVENNTGKIGAYYINKVSEIDFKPEAMLKRQQYLNYQKAWVEFEMEKNAKYWLASPLQDVFAGDMYAPKETARQTTAAFTDITYNGNEYDRWKPAFYQKAWDKGITYYDNPETSESYTAYPVSVVHSNWSIEYNNVDVPYALGKGFYASVEDFDNDVKSESGNSKALVRLPKADASYSYVTKAASSIADRPNSGLLAKGDVTIILTDKDDTNMWGEAQGDNYIYYADGDGKHFLIGNPYMYPLDMEAFFDGNKKEDNTTDLFQRKYWILEDGSTSAVVGTPDVGFGNGTGAIEESNLGQIAPMQAFFVELKEPLEGNAKLEVKFTTSMMAEEATTRSVETKSYSATNPTLTITAERGETKSVAKLVTSDKADNGYEASEDAVVLLDSELDAAMVYTVSGSRAAQVNAMKEISNVGLGVYNENGDEATVTISGLSRMASPLYLYDAQTRKSVELEGDSYTMQITGDSHGRYYLRNSAMAGELENTISIYSAQRGQVIVSALQPVREIKVFNVSGALVRQFSVNTTQYTFPIQSGLYIIYASDGEQEQTEKVIVR